MHFWKTKLTLMVLGGAPIRFGFTCKVAGGRGGSVVGERGRGSNQDHRWGMQDSPRIVLGALQLVQVHLEGGN